MFFKRQMESVATREVPGELATDNSPVPAAPPEEIAVPEDRPLQSAVPPWRVGADERPALPLLRFQVKLEGQHADRASRTVEVEVGAPDEDYARRLARAAWLTAAGTLPFLVTISSVCALGEAPRCGVLRASLVAV